MIREAFALLHLISFFTAGQAQGGARAGDRARHPRPAGRREVHTDMERGFVAAEITPWDDLVRVGGYTAAREQAPRAWRAATTRCATATW